jgi:hypothetical protein
VAEGQRRRSQRNRSAEIEPKREVATVRCPFCHDDVPQDALAARCGKCQTVHHASCFDEKKGCSVDGCGGKAAHVVKGWRSALGECRACHARIYLDENVAVCASCESHHHPTCLEARDGCAECGAGEGLIVSAAAVHAVTATSALKAWLVFLVAATVAGLIAINLTSLHDPLKIGASAALAVVSFLAIVGSAKIASWRKKRAFGLVGQRVVAVKPPPKPET